MHIRTLANLAKLGDTKIQVLAFLVEGKGEISLDPFTITRSWPHGHVAAALGMCRKLGVEKFIDSRHYKMRDFVVAMLVGSVIEPSSKLAYTRGLRSDTASISLGEVY